MQSSTSKKAIAVFFLVFGLGLAFFIFTQGTNLYSGSKGYVTSTATPSIDCIKFFYTVEEISSESGELSFRMRNLDYSADIENITVDGRSLPVLLPKGTSQQIRLAASGSDNFTMYPGSCSVYSTVCHISSNACVRVQ
jgi:hypothetical protein